MTIINSGKIRLGFLLGIAPFIIISIILFIYIYYPNLFIKSVPMVYHLSDDCDPVIFDEMMIFADKSKDPKLIERFIKNIPAIHGGGFGPPDLDFISYNIKLPEKAPSIEAYNMKKDEIRKSGQGLIYDVVDVKPDCPL